MDINFHKDLFGSKNFTVNNALMLKSAYMLKYLETELGDKNHYDVEYEPCRMTYIIRVIYEFDDLTHDIYKYEVNECEFNISAEHTQKVLALLVNNIKDLAHEEILRKRCINDNPQDLLCEYDEDDVGAYVPWI